MSSKKLPEMIVKATAKEGRLLFNNPEDIRMYCIEHDGEDLFVHFQQEAKTADKYKMYAFWYTNILECALLGYTAAGYENLDKVHCDYLLRSELAKDFIRKPDGSYQVIMLDKKNMTKPRLHKLLQDAIFFIENDLQIRVPGSEEFKLKKATGRNFLNIDKP